jgi:hypothetical protein
MFLSVNVGVIDKIKKRAFCELNFSPQLIGISGKIQTKCMIYLHG